MGKDKEAVHPALGGLCAPDGMKWVTRVHDRRLKDGRVIKVRTLKLVPTGS